MRAMIDILAAEVPQIQPRRFREAIQAQQSSAPSWIPWVVGTLGSNSKSRSRRQSCVLPTPPLPRKKTLTSASIRCAGFEIR